MQYQEGAIINNRYKLQRLIGRGSFGEVWLAHDEMTDVDVAIKFYVALDQAGIEEFKNEFRNTHSLNHTNLLHIDYFNIDGTRPYLVMPFCPSSSDDCVGKMGEQDLWKFVRDVASGLAYLHKNDMLHRDIKPANVLVDKSGNYVITDFGLSHKLRSTLRSASLRAQQGPNSSSGSLPYMAPELFSGNPIAVMASDIWALGASVYELATGELPFIGQGGSMINHGAELPSLPDKFSAELNNLMRDCLAKDAWNRPQTAMIVSTAIDALNGNLHYKSIGRAQMEHGGNGGNNDSGSNRENNTKPSGNKIWLLIAALAVVVFAVFAYFMSGSSQSSDEFADTVDEAYDDVIVTELDSAVEVDSVIPETASVVERKEDANSSLQRSDSNTGSTQTSPQSTSVPKPTQVSPVSAESSLSSEQILAELSDEIDNMSLPIKIANGLELDQVYLSKGSLNYVFKVDDDIVDISALEHNRADAKVSAIKAMRASSGDAVARCKKAKLNIVFTYIGKDSGQRLSIPVSYNEL